MILENQSSTYPLPVGKAAELLNVSRSGYYKWLKHKGKDNRKISDRPVVEADELSNGLTIIAKDADFRAIETMVAKWDEAAEPNYITVKVIPLSNQVQADKLAAALKRLYEQVSSSEVKSGCQAG